MTSYRRCRLPSHVTAIMTLHSLQQVRPNIVPKCNAPVLQAVHCCCRYHPAAVRCPRCDEIMLSSCRQFCSSAAKSDLTVMSSGGCCFCSCCSTFQYCCRCCAFITAFPEKEHNGVLCCVMVYCPVQARQWVTSVPQWRKSGSTGHSSVSWSGMLAC